VNAKLGKRPRRQRKPGKVRPLDDQALAKINSISL
jgi:hypothetical protein